MSTACPLTTTTDQKKYGFNMVESLPSSREQQHDRIGVAVPGKVLKCDISGSSRQTCQPAAAKQGHVLALKSEYTRHRPTCK